MFGWTLSLVVWINVWSKSTNKTSLRSFSSLSTSAFPSFWANYIKNKWMITLCYDILQTSSLTFKSGIAWTIGTEAATVTSFFRRSVPHSPHISFITVGCVHSLSSHNVSLQKNLIQFRALFWKSRLPWLDNGAFLRHNLMNCSSLCYL